MSSVNLLVKGNLLITGSQLINSTYNKNITLWGTWTDNVANGFAPGKGTVSFEGTSMQTIVTPNPEHFFNFRINNPAGVTLSGTAEVSKMLYLVSGRINTSDANLLTLTNSSATAVIGGSDASFVDGPLSKLIMSGQSFSFPVGNFNVAAAKPSRFGWVKLSNVSATNYWKARYVNADPNPTYNRSSRLSPITSVSDNEYWQVTRPSANTANVTLRWDAASAILAVPMTRVVEWVTPTNRWEEKGSAASGNIAAGTVSTTTPVSTDNYVFTLGVSGVTARITQVSPATICNNGEIVSVTVVLTGTPNWTLKYQAGTQTFTQSGIGSGTYNIQLTGLDLGGPGTRNIQLLSVSDITGTGIVDASVYPVVVKSTFVPDIQGNFTVGAGEIRNYLTTTNTGSTYSWSWQGTNGGTIAAPTASSTNVTITTPGAFPAVYQLKVVETSSNGCTAQDVQSITVVNAPSPVITPEDANQCLNNVVTYSTPSITGHSYLWTIVGGTPATGTGNSITVTWNTIGSGSISVVENNSGITGTDVVNVVVDPMPNAALVVSTPATVCYNSPAIITVNASQTGISYQLREGAIPVGSPVAGTGGNIGLTSLPLTTSTTFNVLAYNNGCSTQLTQTVTIGISDPAAPGGAATQSFCAINNPTVASLVATGTSIQWYAAATDGTALAPADALVTGTTYYASQTVSGCESRSRFAVSVTITDPTAPTGNAMQDFCAINNPTVANLTATGTAIKWYTVATGGSALATTTALATGTYYASQTTGGCESTNRLAVAVEVLPVPATSVISGSTSLLCRSSGVVYSVVLTAGSSYEWTVPAGAAIVGGTTGPENNQITVNFGNQSGIVSVTETNAGGCSGEPVELAVTLLGCELEALFTASETIVCIGEEVTFTDQSKGTSAGTAYSWDFGSGATPSSATLSGPHLVTYSTAGLKTVRLIITEGLSDTLTLTDYISVQEAPVLNLENAERCGPGTVEMIATVNGANQVDFSLDGGVSVAWTDNVSPFTYNVDVAESQTVNVWGRAINNVTGCEGSWEQAFAVSNPTPATEKIAASHAAVSVPGYVDVVCAGQQNTLYYVNGESVAMYNWRIPELGISVDNATQLEVDWDVAGGDYVVLLQKYSDKGCPGNVRDTLVLVSQPLPDLGADITSCDGETHEFKLTEDYTAYEWNDFSSGPALTVTETGKVYVKVWDEYGCNGSDTAMFVLGERPVVDLGPDTVLCGDVSYVLDAGEFATYQWSTGEIINPITLHEGAGKVSVTVTNAAGCEASDEIEILPCNPASLLGTIPNTFTPNDDQIHDAWEIKKIYLFPNAVIQVFDRWGRLVFKSNGGYANNWYGTDSSGNKLPIETYYYIIDLRADNFPPITGNVTIIR
jgi:gliding motility-associated-like protein